MSNGQGRDEVFGAELGSLHFQQAHVHGHHEWIEGCRDKILGLLLADLISSPSSLSAFPSAAASGSTNTRIARLVQTAVRLSADNAPTGFTADPPR